MLFVLPRVGAVVETVAAAVSVGTAVTAGVASVVIGTIAAKGTNVAIHAGVREVIKSVTED